MDLSFTEDQELIKNSVDKFILETYDAEHRRKTIKNNFKDILNEKDFNFLKINPQDRAEMLSIDTFVNIENYMYDNNISL